MSEALVSVIIPVFGQSAELDECLTHLARQDIGTAAFEVIVVDNGSPVPVCPEGWDQLHVRVISEPEPGSYSARNAGLLAARAPFVAFTDADCRPRGQWLSTALQALMRAEGPDLVGGPIEVFARSPGRPSCVEAYELLRAFPQERYVLERNFSATANMVARRTVFDAVGLFDARLRSGGDREFGQRASAAGFRWEFVPQASVSHPARQHWGELNRKLARVIAGNRDARLHSGSPLITASEIALGLVPPLGAVRRSRHERLPRTRDRIRYVAAEVFVRYAGTYQRLRSAFDAESPRT